jgi:hypothetical protein
VSTAPIDTVVGQDLYDAVEPLTFADESLGWPLANFLSSLGLMLDEEARLVRADDDGNDGWSAFADPQRCPVNYLYTLAQWAGVRYPRRMSVDDLRALIGPHAPGVWRGTKAAILAAVRRYLAPGGTLYFEERADGDAYKLRIFTYTTSTLDEAAIETELMGAIPAGLILDYQLRSGQSYADLVASGLTYLQVRTKYATYHTMSTDVPKVAA